MALCDIVVEKTTARGAAILGWFWSFSVSSWQHVQLTMATWLIGLQLCWRQRSTITCNVIDPYSIPQRAYYYTYRRQHFLALISVTTHNDFSDFIKINKAAWRLFRQSIDASCTVSALITIHQALSRGMITIRTRQQQRRQQLTTYQGLSLGICIDSLFCKCSPKR